MKVFIGVLIVAVLAFLGDALLTNIAEERAAEQVGAELGADVDVELSGWPVSVRLLMRRVPEVRVVATGVPLRDSPAILSRFEATLRDVDVPWTWSGQLEGQVSAETGRFVAELDEAAVQALVQLPITVTLEEGIIRGSIGGAQLDVTAEVVEGAIVLRPAAETFAGLGELRLPLDGLPEGAVVESVRVETGVLAVEGTLTDVAVASDAT